MISVLVLDESRIVGLPGWTYKISYNMDFKASFEILVNTLESMLWDNLISPSW